MYPTESVELRDARTLGSIAAGGQRLFKPVSMNLSLPGPRHPGAGLRPGRRPSPCLASGPAPDPAPGRPPTPRCAVAAGTPPVTPYSPSPFFLKSASSFARASAARSRLVPEPVPGPPANAAREK